jgi:hypothetical protein
VDVPNWSVLVPVAATLLLPSTFDAVGFPPEPDLQLAAVPKPHRIEIVNAARRTVKRYRAATTIVQQGYLRSWTRANRRFFAKPVHAARHSHAKHPFGTQSPGEDTAGLHRRSDA